MNWPSIALLCILIPIGTGLLSLFLNSSFPRKVVVILNSIFLSTLSILLYIKGPFPITNTFTKINNFYDYLICGLDFLLLFYIVFIGTKLKNRTITIMSSIQIIILFLVEIIHNKSDIYPLVADKFSLMMILIVSIVGSIITIYALQYMKRHEEHLHLTTSKQNKFFFFMLIFLGAMNGLILSNNLLWMYFFWEVTTLCSFMLIGHDDTDEAKANAQKALWMNLLGGVTFILGLFILALNHLPLEITLLLNSKIGSSMLLVMALLCIAGFTKSAQVPFQSWLTGAMVAPTPVSALLHSSTMVNAGVYLILRLAPIYQKTLFSSYLAFLGAFTFIATSILALSQKNGKKILAYSTIGNLGMIVACAGIGSPAAIGAGILLILFHAVSKGLLFMGMGYIEQNIGSRIIEDMRGLYLKMPKTTLIMAFGMLTMFLPPFGALLSKWMIIEASSKNPMVVIMLALGSAFTVVFWARWAGLILCHTKNKKPSQEILPLFIRLSFFPLALLIALLSILVLPIYSNIIVPTLKLYYKTISYSLLQGGFNSEVGAFSIYPLFLFFIIATIWTIHVIKKYSKRTYVNPYMSGIEEIQNDNYGHLGPLNQFVKFTAGNFYLLEYLGEEKLMLGINIIAIGTIIVSIAGVF
ncbi:ech hydrogenase subunit A [Desulfonauticus submarinus]|uniref:Ech hydrogenase subunit A n=1 Tax=Desulfonauticus submarinus TaxID=206665 RepID=A0A1H0G1R5_9BACT|nr:proton-conducting transporter membrane subunit [Desulfonauticus submarinus]SDO00800.1 ech hydrogenase subunit A [Desulfonauticus submarinus]